MLEGAGFLPPQGKLEGTRFGDLLSPRPAVDGRRQGGCSWRMVSFEGGFLRRVLGVGSEWWVPSPTVRCTKDFAFFVTLKM